MMPYEPWNSSAIWYQRWRELIYEAKTNPDQAYGFGQAAMLAQGLYLMHMAIDKVKNFGRKSQ